MVARPESVPFDELNPSQILLEHGAGLHAAADRVDDDVFMHLSASPKQRCASYFNDAAPPSMRADELRWADRTAAAGLIARSPVAVHMLNSRLRHSISPMMEVYTHDVEDEDDGADGGRSGERTAEEDNDGDDATAVAAATAAAATGAQRPVAFARLPPPTAAIRIPTMPHVKRKWGYRGKRAPPSAFVAFCAAFLTLTTSCDVFFFCLVLVRQTRRRTTAR